MDKNFQFGSLTDVGLVRKVNEDFIGNFETVNGEIFVLCDGLGGHIGGANASKIAVESINRFFQYQVYAYPKDALQQALVYAN
ncbi:MAG: serine/threonine-protein phosphatase, partial [Verrucomicrobia bacterium]|nr:serine/threonine-protein phosphatase [Cytophagales bacterium]